MTWLEFLCIGTFWTMTRAFVFPGQGSQTVGMGRDLAEANFKGMVQAGFLGGSITGIYTEIAQEIVQFIKASF